MDWQKTLTRRMALTGMAAASLVGRRAEAQPTSAAPAAEAGAPAAVTAQGTVFEDADGSGRRNAGSRGVPGVMVSNGRDVAVTDAEGHWSLPAREGDSLFVIKPTGWMTPIAPETNLPRFSYIYEPQGTPAGLGLRYPGIAPTGPLPASIDFPLHRQTEPTQFNVVLFTDPQPESLNELGYVRDDVVAQVTGIDARFGITTGDIMFDDLSAYGRSNRIVGSLGLPWYNCCGNHDMNYEAPDNSFSRETYKGVYGARYSAFQYGGVTFFLLDNVDYLGNHSYQGRFGPDQLGFIRQVLAHVPNDQLVVLCMHIPLRTLAGDGPAIAATDWQDFLGVIAGRPATVSFSGHTHTNEHHYLSAAGAAAFPWPWPATARPTASMCCPSTEPATRHGSTPRMIRSSRRCGSCSTPASTRRTPRSWRNTCRASCSSAPSARRRPARRASSSTSTMAARSPPCASPSAARAAGCRCSGSSGSIPSCRTSMRATAP
jgi:hypothetical protein